MFKETRQVNTYSGVVLEKEIFSTGWRGALSGSPRPSRERFATEEEREKHREQMSRKLHAQLVNANLEPGDLYVTLTCDVQHEIHTVEDAKWIRDNFVRRLRYKYPDAVIFIYMGRGGRYGRFHFHALIKGIPMEYIFHQWPYAPGKEIKYDDEHSREDGAIMESTAVQRDGVLIRLLDQNRKYNGVDHGPDYTGLANYLFDHWTPEQGGHRWKMTRNVKRPEREEDTSEPEEVRQQYTVDNPPPAPRGYIWVESRSTPYGYLYFKYVKQPPKKKRKTAKKQTGK